MLQYMLFVQDNNLFKVTFLAACILLTETLLFHVLNYIHNFYVATLAISLVMLGIAAGALVVPKIKLKVKDLFSVCCLGMVVSLFITAVFVVFYPKIWVLALVIPLCFIFPVAFIMRMFTDEQVKSVYLFDMIGAGLGVIFTVKFFDLFITEEIYLLLILVVSVAGLLSLKKLAPKTMKFIYVSLLCIAISSCALLVIQIKNDSLNLFRIINRDAGLNTRKLFMFSNYKPEMLVKSYDSLAGRIDLFDRGSSYLVAYNGFGNDHFENSKSVGYRPEKGEKVLTKDIRVLHGPVKEPKVFVIGSSAQGIIKPLKTITPPENIYTVELNPNVIKIMQEDFYEESGRAYENLNPNLGNGISVLKSVKKKFDIITMINTHASKSISIPGAPDYLHTNQTYDLFFDRLSDKGYLLMEEQVSNRDGELGMIRMLNTLWQTLKQRGAENPSEHFVVWEWMSSIVKHEDYEINPNHYISLIVTKEPLRGEFRESVFNVLDGMIEERHSRNWLARLAYANGKSGQKEFEKIFSMIESGDFGSLEQEGFNSAIVTKTDRLSGLCIVNLSLLSTRLSSPA
ncbi:hypothetical protein KKF03_03570 [Patescibacteria group bacterium]|nr:hypothetical protein [Patescibacteria group bacterium]